MAIAYNELHISCRKTEARFLLSRFKETVHTLPSWSVVETKYCDDFAQGIDVSRDLVLMLYHLNAKGIRTTCLFMSYNNEKERLEINNIGGNSWLSPETYNRVLEDFRRDIVRPNLSISFKCEINSPAEEAVKNMPSESLKLLKTFAIGGSKDSPHHNDMERWNDFVISIVRNGRPKISDTTIRDLLIGMKFPEKTATYWADRFIWEYWLLCKYDSM
jgi:hypothetical protein